MNSQGNAAQSYFGLPSAPIFYPTREEFADPWKYLNSIRTQVVQCGIGIIQPPQGEWDFDSFKKQIDPTRFSFITKAQNIHQMQHRDGPNVSFILALRKFWRARGSSLDALPEICGVLLDLYRLKNEIVAHGGLDQVDAKQKWQVIAENLKLVAHDDTENHISAVSSQLRSTYMKVLHPFLVDAQLDGVVSENKRKLEDASDEQSKKRQKIDMKDANGDPLWMQVKSRSFAKDPADIKVTRFSSATKTGKMMSGVQLEKEEEECEDDPETLRNNFGYQEGRYYTLEEFQKMANRFERLCCGNATLAQKEAKYWEIIEKGEEFIQVYYGSDLDVAVHGSGFPISEGAKTRRASKLRNSTSKENATQEYMRQCGWNVNNLSASTFLHHINEAVAGVTRPMMYVGMLFTNFCWHTEDNYLYSVNYVHTGQPKLWYGIPGSHAEHFERSMQSKLPELFRRHPNLLHLLITQLSPRVLVEAGVPVYTTVQKAGQFIVTCPRAYHAGFNTGFNVAESVNFALEDWLPFCRIACSNYRYQRSPIFPHEEFVLKAAKTPDNLEIAKILQEEVKAIIQSERLMQRNLHKEGITQYITLTCDYQPCADCGYDCYLSGITCNNHPGNLTCLSHVKNLCPCPSSDKRLVIRVHLMELKQILDKLVQRTKEMEVEELNKVSSNINSKSDGLKTNHNEATRTSPEVMDLT